MKAAAGLLLLLLPLLLKLCHGAVTFCDFRQNNTKCFGPPGGSVVFQLPNNTGTTIRYIWFRNTAKLLEWEKDKKPIFNDLKTRTVISNSSVTLNNLSSKDAGEYKLKMLRNGNFNGSWTVQLFVQAPVSSVWMSSQYLSQGETQVSCHSEGGDGLSQYSWSLNGVQLDSTENDSSSVTLKPGESGYVVCTISNNVSEASSGQNISERVFMNCTLLNGTYISRWVPGGTDLKCSEATTTAMPSTVGKETGTTVSKKPSTNITTSSQSTYNTTDHPWYIKHMIPMVAVVSALLFLLLAALLLACLCKKRLKDKGEGSAQVEDGQELTYANVQIMKCRRVVKTTVEQDVEYGQVKISTKPQSKPPPKEEECVYAKVQVSR